MTIEEAMVRLRAYPEFRVVMEAAEDERPFLRPMIPKEDLDKQAVQMLHTSGRIEGFDLLMNFLRGNDEWQSRSK